MAYGVQSTRWARHERGDSDRSGESETVDQVDGNIVFTVNLKLVEPVSAKVFSPDGVLLSN